MKKLFIITIIIIILFNIFNYKEKQEEFRGVFISYIELSDYLNKSDNESRKSIDEMINKINDLGFNTIILQVRIASDSIYNSKIFPRSKYIDKTSYDLLDYFIEKSHEKDIKLYCWINPYRISTTNDINNISENNPAYKYLNTDTIYISNGIYYNPAKEEVTKLIVDGVKEVLNYKIDGILFDDYFYPSKDIDIKDYEEYLKSNSYIDLNTYHLNVINNMIFKVHEECKKKNIRFGISPEGNIDNNYEKNYADVKLWMSSNKYIDFIMPQIYYGFYNSSKPFSNTIKEWEGLLKNKNIDLYIALALYKVGEKDLYAKEGEDEWINNNDILMREIIMSRNLNNYKGFSLFRYGNLNDSKCQKEVKNIKKILN